MALRRYRCAYNEDGMPLAAQAIPTGWGSEPDPENQGQRLVVANLSDEQHLAVLALEGVSEA